MALVDKLLSHVRGTSISQVVGNVLCLPEESSDTFF